MVLFGNENGQACIYTYWLDDVFLGPRTDIPGGEIICVVQTGTFEFLIGHELGIYRYENASGSVTDWMPGMNADAMTYDLVRDLVVVASGKDVSFFRVSDASSEGGVILPYPVLQLHVQNNK
jgi:hypothetical protein